jgi:nuclear pore complex protein Nup85
MSQNIGISLGDGQSIGHKWCFGNELTIYSKSNYDWHKNVKQLDSQLVNYKCVKPLIYTNRISRSLLSESLFVFKSLQRVSSKSEPLSRNELIKASRKYRSVIHSCFFNLINDSENSDSLSLSDMFSQMEIVWNLCEILYMDIDSTGFVLNQLLNWIKWHFTQINRMATSVMNAEMPYIHENYWDVVICYIMRAEMENATLFLEFHSDAYTKQEFVLLRNLIKKMPLISTNQLLHEYYLRWQSWNEECLQALNDGHFDLNHRIKLIVRILVGDIDAFKEVLHLFESWYQLMVSLLLFTDPCIKENNLSSLCLQCIDIYSAKDNSNQELNSFDSLVIAAFSYDLMEVIQESCLCFADNWWFATHFLDLLYNANQLDGHQIENPSKFRESFIIEYANSLMTCQSLWQFGIEYLSHCLDNGLHYIELNLQRISFTNDLTAQKVIYFANKMGLNYISKSISKILSRRWLAKQKLGLALFWAIRSEDPTLTNHIADIFLMQYDKSGQFPDEDILSNLGRLMLISDRLTFLAKYYEFHQLKKECQLNSAAELLVSLLVSNIAPKFFIIKLLMDSLPLLETQNLVLNSEQTCQLLASLEEMLSFGQNCSDKNINIEFLKEREDILRLAIARNLARAFVLLD